MWSILRRALLVGALVLAGVLCVGLLPPAGQTVVGWLVLAYLVRGAWSQISRDVSAVTGRLFGSGGRHGGSRPVRAARGDL